MVLEVDAGLLIKVVSRLLNLGVDVVSVMLYLRDSRYRLLILLFQVSFKFSRNLLQCYLTSGLHASMCPHILRLFLMLYVIL